MKKGAVSVGESERKRRKGEKEKGGYNHEIASPIGLSK